jgi:hypothetical protein
LAVAVVALLAISLIAIAEVEPVHRPLEHVTVVFGPR